MARKWGGMIIPALINIGQSVKVSWCVEDFAASSRLSGTLACDLRLWQLQGLSQCEAIAVTPSLIKASTHLTPAKSKINDLN